METLSPKATTASTASAPTSAMRASARAGAGIAPAVALLEPDNNAGWSIDDEPAGPGWHESSWLLRRGLDVIEGVPPQFWPLEWRRALQ